MSWKTSGKVLLLVALGVTTFCVTSSLVAGRGKKSTAAPPKVAERGKLKAMNGPKPAAASPIHPAKNVTSIDGMDVVLRADGLHVLGQATVHDERPGVAFVWAVRVRDPEKKVYLADPRYDTQVFQTPRDTYELHPTFFDTLNAALPPGTYKVELVLYEVPPGGVDFLNDRAFREQQLMAKHSVTLRVQP
jgi:hypothetical protein